jgi:hypothetical protein
MRKFWVLLLFELVTKSWCHLLGAYRLELSHPAEMGVSGDLSANRLPGLSRLPALPEEGCGEERKDAGGTGNRHTCREPESNLSNIHSMWI